MFKSLIPVFGLMVMALAVEFPSKKYLSLSAIKTMIAGAEMEARRLHVELTLCVVDENGNLIFLQKPDAMSPITTEWAQKKARYAAFYGCPSKEAEETVKMGHVEALAHPAFFPNQGGLPIKLDGRTIGGIAASGATSEIDEAVAQAGLDALFKS